MTNTKTHAISFLTVALATTLILLMQSCGDGVVDGEEDDAPGSGRETYFRHGTPPGPAPWQYQLTSYDDPGTPACGSKSLNGTSYFATGAYTFGCGSRLLLEANGKCVVVAVVDNGPAAWVERKAKSKCGGTGYVIDASPLVSKHLFGTSSAGWSDCYSIQVTEVAKNAKTGPSSCGVGSGDPFPTPGPEPAPGSEPTQSFIGDRCTGDGSCSGGLCLSAADGFPDGSCSQSCESLCPDQRGKAITFCTDVGGQPRCVSRCDTALHGGNGCRDGYRCVRMRRWSDASVEQDVCLP